MAQHATEQTETLGHRRMIGAQQPAAALQRLAAQGLRALGVALFEAQVRQRLQALGDVEMLAAEQLSPPVESGLDQVAGPVERAEVAVDLADDLHQSSL